MKNPPDIVVASSQLSPAERREKREACACAALRFLTDQLCYAVFVVSRDSKLVHANSAGNTLLESDSPFQLTRGQLYMQGVVAANWLATQSITSRRMRSALVNHRGARDRQETEYRVAVANGTLQRADDPIVFCVYSNVFTPRQLNAETLRDLYELTQAEAETAVGVFNGQTLVELARERKTSIHTVRTQLKRVFHKCQVRSQLQLCRLLGIAASFY